MKTYTYLFLTMALAFPMNVVRAQSAPPMINDQGQLVDVDGQPAPTADYELTFRNYRSAEGTEEIWGSHSYRKNMTSPSPLPDKGMKHAHPCETHQNNNWCEPIKGRRWK